MPKVTGDKEVGDPNSSSVQRSEQMDHRDTDATESLVMSSDHHSEGDEADNESHSDRPSSRASEEEDGERDEDDVVRERSPPLRHNRGSAQRWSSEMDGTADDAKITGSRSISASVSSAICSANGLFWWLRQRMLGRGLFVDPARDNFRTMTSMYRSMNPADSVNLSTKTHGAVFNLEYSPDGSVLTVACEQTEVLLFDPISSRHIRTLVEAHEDCVNNIRFLDNRLFATCSDDTTIALWDLRNLNSKVCSLHGHASWVKNIEYDTNTRLLVTSGFDGNVITWDTNRFTEEGCPHKKFFHTRYLMRMRLTPDCSKMLISTSSGYLLILHDLDLTQSLEVGSYRTLRARRTTLNADGSRTVGAPRRGNEPSKGSAQSSPREGAPPRNSLEVLTPEIPGERDRGNCITSLQLHPKGWATLLRCSSNADDQEWTCVYEFQEGAPPPRAAATSPRRSLRLTHYIEEANVGRGYIKELCFSPDGRLICSPYGYGIRLLAFDGSCGELTDCLPGDSLPTSLREVRSIYSHSDVVLTTKFSPTHCQLASGCLSGRVSLYQPKF